jgi:uncharacterized cupin superfamily protein
MIVPGGFEPPLHLHREIAESLYLLAGRLDLQVGDERQMFANGEPDPETAGPLLAQLDMEMLTPAAS